MLPALLRCLSLSLAIALPASAQSPDANVDSLRFEVPVLVGVERYAGLLEHPAYLAVALESIGLSPSISSRLKIGEQGKSVEIRNAFVRFTGKTGSVYRFNAGVSIGLGDSKLDFPVTVDTAEIAKGKALITLTPPLASLVPTELTDRIRVKLQMVANAGAQKKMLDHLDQLAKQAASGTAGLSEAILADAYNRGGGPAGAATDKGESIPLSDQWLLILTLLVWLVVVPVFLLIQRIRQKNPPRPMTSSLEAAFPSVSVIIVERLAVDAEGTMEDQQCLVA